MLFRLILAIAFAGFLGAVTLPSHTIAQTTQTEEKKETKKKTTKTKEEKDETKKKSTKTKEEKGETKKKAEKKEEKEKKKLTPAQQKFSDCAKSWGDHKKETGEKTKDQYNAYMSKCMKKQD